LSPDLQRLILDEAIPRELNLEKASIYPLRHSGVNSNIYVIKTNDQKFILKKFRTLSNSDRSRFDAENFALDFFKKYKIKSVPEKLFSSRRNNFILMTFANGVRPKKFSPKIAQQAVKFIDKIHMASLDKNFIKPVYAVEAFLSPQELYNQIDNRIENCFLKISKRSPVTSFLNDQLVPLYKSLREAASSKLSNKKIEVNQMTFSVVDFGLNNFLLNENNLLQFIDFEFSGMDDPVKLVSDSLFHPANNFTAKNIKKYQPIFCKVFQDTDPSFEGRFEEFYLFFGIKWCLIMLNRFLHLKLESYQRDDLMQLKKTEERLRILKELC